ncbi:MAG: trypsin-like peptidase domain-containing protein [Candidatus Gracilibacteria bacterium]|nr:trypsin-like peptidase domain-containing protein [Candidatus Gracilibacteria bacterium]
MKKLLLICICFTLSIMTVSANNLDNVLKIYNYQYDPTNDAFYQYSQGSAVLIDNKTIITNAHVILDAEDKVSNFYAICKTIDFKKSPICTTVGDLQYYNISKDLALLELNQKSDFTGVTFGKEIHDIGSDVYAYGYPGNGGGTISFTKGKISGYDTGKYKIDADIDSGSSGGAAFDSEGNLIGLTDSVVVGYTTSGRVIPLGDIQDFLNKKGEITYHKESKNLDFKGYIQKNLELQQSNSIKNEYFTISNINNSIFHLEDIVSTKKSDVYRYDFYSDSKDTYISIGKDITTGNNLSSKELINFSKRITQGQKNITNKIKEVKINGKKVLVFLTIDKQNKTIDLGLSEDNITTHISGNLNNQRELKKALHFYFKNIRTTSQKDIRKEVSIGGIGLQSSKNSYFVKNVNSSDDYFSLSGFIRTKDKGLAMMRQSTYTLDKPSNEDEYTFESYVESIANNLSSDENILLDKGIVKNKNGVHVGYIGYKYNSDGSVLYSIFTFNYDKEKDTYTNSYFQLIFQTFKENDNDTVREFMDNITISGSNFTKIKDPSNIKKYSQMK